MNLANWINVMLAHDDGKPDLKLKIGEKMHKLSVKTTGNNAVDYDGVDYIEIEIKGGGRGFRIYEQGGDLVVKKIECNKPNGKAMERMLLHPCFDDQIRIR